MNRLEEVDHLGKMPYGRRMDRVTNDRRKEVGSYKVVPGSVGQRSRVVQRPTRLMTTRLNQLLSRTMSRKLKTFQLDNANHRKSKMPRP